MFHEKVQSGRFHREPKVFWLFDISSVDGSLAPAPVPFCSLHVIKIWLVEQESFKLKFHSTKPRMGSQSAFIIKMTEEIWSLGKEFPYAAANVASGQE